MRPDAGLMGCLVSWECPECRALRGPCGGYRGDRRVSSCLFRRPTGAPGGLARSFLSIAASDFFGNIAATQALGESVELITTIFKFLGDNWGIALAVFLFSMVFPHLYPEQMTGDLRTSLEISLLASACVIIAKATVSFVNAVPGWIQLWSKGAAQRRTAKERDDFAFNAVGHLTVSEKEMLQMILSHQADANGMFRKWWPSGRAVQNGALDGLRKHLIVSPARPPGVRILLYQETEDTVLWVVARGVMASREEIIERLREELAPYA